MQLLNLKKLSSPVYLIQSVWPALNKLPAGNRIFSKLVGQFIPYTGSISPLVEKIEPGYARTCLKDKRAVRNHLKCVHAIALANIGELTTGLAIISQFSQNEQAILVKLDVEYLKKARGTLTVEASAHLPPLRTDDTDVSVTAEIKNSQTEVVCNVHATWRVRS